MGLENLKSAFGNILANTNSSDIRYPQDPSGLHAPPHEQIDGAGVDSNIYPESFSSLDIDGIPEQFLPDSILDASTIPIEVIDSFESPVLSDIYNNLETPPTESSDIRFNAGFSTLFQPAKMKLQIATEGAEASLFYIDSAGGATFGVSGAFSKFGKLSDLAQKSGIKLPVYDFAVPIISVPPLTYPNQVEEMFNDGSNLTDDFVDNTGDGRRTRGIVFQVLGTQNKTGEKPDFSFQDKVQRDTANILGMEIPMPFTIDTNKEYIDKQMKAWKDSGGLFPKVEKNKKTENELIQSEAKKILGKDGLSGFGNKLKNPPKDSFLGGVGDFFSGMGDKISAFGSNISDGISDIAGPLMSDLKDFGNKINPLDNLQLPQIRFSQAVTFNKAPFGGQAKFKQNQPRALDRLIPIKTANPFGEEMDASATLVSRGIADREYVINDVSTPYADIGKNPYGGQSLAAQNASTAFYPNASIDEKSGGDKMTLAPMLTGEDLSVYDAAGVPGWVESEDNGMPVYFKDLRDNSYLIFRGYIEGITEAVSPNWSATTYIGRSEATHTYENADRSVNFTLKLIAQTAPELDAIYSKMNRLTSLAYPEYAVDKLIQTGQKDVMTDEGSLRVPVYKSRMKPPMTRMRLGELYGNSNIKRKDGILGFIKSLSYEYPDESPWEYRKGQRVPKMVNVSIEYQIIHERVPDMSYTDFYGYYPTLLNHKFDKTSVVDAANSLGSNNEEDDDFFDD